MRNLPDSLAERFPEERRRNPFVYEDSFSVLDQLKGNYKLLLLTNGSPDLQNTKLDITPELVPYFDEIVISGAFGRGKPDPTIFEHALSLLNIEKEEALMVGDNLMTDILGAKRAGIKSVWINRHDKERNEVIPDYEIKHLSELFTILDDLRKSLENLGLLINRRFSNDANLVFVIISKFKVFNEKRRIAMGKGLVMVNMLY